MPSNAVYIQQMWKTCKSKLVIEVTENEGHEQYYLVSVHDTSHDNEWTVTLNTGNRPADFKSDTGADCSVISETV